MIDNLLKAKRYLPYLAGAGVAFAWGFAFFFTKFALDHLDPFHLLGLRFAVAVGAMAILRALGIIKIKVRPADYINLLPLVVFLPVLYFSMETTGIMLTSASFSGMMLAVIPVFVTVFAALFLREYPNQFQWMFILASVFGAFFVIYMDARPIADADTTGTLFLLGAVIAGAGYNIAARRASLNHTPVKATWIMMVIGAFFFNFVSLIQHFRAGRLNTYFPPPAGCWASIGYLGAISSVAAFFMYNFILREVTAPQAAVFYNMVTVVAIGAGVIFLGEALAWYHILGTVAVLTGVWGTNFFASNLRSKSA